MKINPELFFDKITEALKAELPFVAYRHPNAEVIKGFFQKNDDLHFTSDFSKQGFVFAPFDDAKASVLFPLTETTIYSTSFSNVEVFDEDKNHSMLPAENSKIAHINLVQKGIDFLNTTNVKKVVLSRKEIIETTDFNVVKTFKKLLQNYLNAMVYVWFHPKIGLWLGATPETLLQVKNNTFTTMALAGTQPYQGSLEVEWKNKETQEQQFVTDYIIDKLKNTVNVSKPHTIRAGSLVHLCTLISGKLSQEFSLHKLIKLLHPTPAVCGLPMNDAKKFILENEKYQREFYTGFLGEINVDNTSNLFVNLRCMQLIENKLAIYVGGGITIDSIPEKEWQETVDKSKVMLTILGLS